MVFGSGPSPGLAQPDPAQALAQGLSPPASASADKAFVVSANRTSFVQADTISVVSADEIHKFPEVAGSQVPLSPSNGSKSENAASG